MTERLRIAVGLRYDGSAYHGWQRQQDLATVQQRVEHAFSFVANQKIITTCAGRTDAGVHATAQVVHFDTTAQRTEYSWMFGANANLPNDITVTWCKQVPLTFHARFSAKSRRYRYVIFNADVRPGILRHAIAWHHRPLDEAKMHAAGQLLLGEHDFSAFRGAGCQSSTPMRCVEMLTVTRLRRMIIIEIKANAFLLHMVRNIAGVLMKIGEGQESIDWAGRVLASKDRRQASVTVGPQGLYLVEVDYVPTFQLPKTPVGPFFLP